MGRGVPPAPSLHGHSSSGTERPSCDGAAVPSACPGEPALPMDPAPPAQGAWGVLASQPQVLPCCGAEELQQALSTCPKWLESLKRFPYTGLCTQTVPELWFTLSPPRKHLLPSLKLFPNPTRRLAASNLRAAPRSYQETSAETGWSLASIRACALSHPDPQSKGGHYRGCETQESTKCFAMWLLQQAGGSSSANTQVKSPKGATKLWIWERLIPD